jgi:hypothetical protein
VVLLWLVQTPQVVKRQHQPVSLKLVFETVLAIAGYEGPIHGYEGPIHDASIGHSTRDRDQLARCIHRALNS